MVEQVVVIGAGVYGAAVAAELTRRGARVTVVDAGAPGAGTSSATFSWTNANGGKKPRAYHDLNVGGMEAHRRLARDMSGSDWYHEGGNLEWGGDDAEREELIRKVDTVLGYGYEARWLTRADVLRLEPDMNPAELTADEIAYFPTEGWVEPVRLIGHLLSNSSAEQVWNDAVVGFETADGLVRSVRLASGQRLPADAVVNCAGPQAAKVARLAGLDLPMRNRRGVLIYTAPVAVSVSRVIRAPRVDLRPDGGGRILLHTHAVDDAARVSATGEIAVDQAAVDKVVEAGCALYPGIRAANIESVRVGERPIPGDGLPVLGPAPELSNFYFAVSHSGVTLSLYAGGLLAAEVLGENHTEELAAFRYDRL
ncbi:NAD(P)/FAD-dependent oxidoreductase [Streptomyces sp. NPDC017964]|uniref:NAD(P)/FAD-dependent oxidoreductase n=1 Tax=Streptomyces sp. NPDC017964 TaxID=3365022 RepID=UPI0037AE1B0A